MIIASRNDLAALTIRLTVAIVLFPHGAQKLLGWWDGHGYSSTMNFLIKDVGLPSVIAWLVIMVEFFCPLLLAAGLASRLCAFGVLIVMGGIIVTVQNQYFFMNWFNDQKGEGMEFFLLIIGLCIALIVNGSGKYSLDRLIVNGAGEK